jgi:hypothetical protein
VTRSQSVDGGGDRRAGGAARAMSAATDASKPARAGRAAVDLQREGPGTGKPVEIMTMMPLLELWFCLGGAVRHASPSLSAQPP